jgi:hypothetical protein
MVSRDHDAIDLEHDGWKALSTDGHAVRAFYERVLDRHPLMLLPGGLRLEGQADILRSMSGPPWTHVELEKPEAWELGQDVAVVVYGVVAQREDGSAYSAQVSSTYVRRADAWKLALHQQTPR